MQFTYTPKAPDQDDKTSKFVYFLTGADTQWKTRITTHTERALARLEFTHYHAGGHSNLSLDFTPAEFIVIAKGLIDAAAALDPAAILQDGPSA